MNKRLDALRNEQLSIYKNNKLLREAMDTIQSETKKSTIQKSTDDTEIESLVKKRKELRQKVNKTLKDKVDYAELK